MKNLLRNNLWMMIVAWCLETRGYGLLAIGVCAFSSIYLLINLRSFEPFKALIISIIFMLYCYLLASVTVVNQYPNFVLFLGCVCLNVGITYEVLQKERLKYLYQVFIFTLSSYVVFFLATLFMPKVLMYEITKVNTLTLIMIVFLPYTSLMLIQVIKKEYQKKLLLDKIERISKAKEFDIKA